MAAKKKKRKYTRRALPPLDIKGPVTVPAENEAIANALMTIKHALRLVYLAGERAGIDNMATRLDEKLKMLGGP